MLTGRWLPACSSDTSQAGAYLLLILQLLQQVLLEVLESSQLSVEALDCFDQRILLGSKLLLLSYALPCLCRCLQLKKQEPEPNSSVYCESHALATAGVLVTHDYQSNSLQLEFCSVCLLNNTPGAVICIPSYYSCQ